MRYQRLRPETILKLRSLDVGKSYNGFTRVNSCDVDQLLQQSVSILMLMDDHGCWVQSMGNKTNLYFKTDK